MKTAISIPDHVFAAAEAAAKRLSMSRSQFFTKAVEEYLTSHSDAVITDRLNAVYAEEDSHVDPVLQRLQALSLERDAW